MYHEFGQFCGVILRQRAVWLSGEFLTSLALGAGSFCFFHYVDTDSKHLGVLYGNLGNLLTVVSIIFGFASASFLYYVQIADTWKESPEVKKAANLLVDWNTLTVLCILLLMIYMTFLLVMDSLFTPGLLKESLYAFLVFQIFYCLLQLICHSLLIWFTFRKRRNFRKESQEKQDP
jgi:hypothetical protein